MLKKRDKIKMSTIFGLVHGHKSSENMLILSNSKWEKNINDKLKIYFYTRDTGNEFR